MPKETIHSISFPGKSLDASSKAISVGLLATIPPSASCTESIIINKLEPVHNCLKRRQRRGEKEEKGEKGREKRQTVIY